MLRCLQGQACLEIMSSRLGLFRGLYSKSELLRHDLKVRIVLRSCLQGQCCLDIMFTRSGLFRGHVSKVRIVLKSCFKVRIV